MVICPHCNWKKSKVVDKRPNQEGSINRRRRECLSCFKRYTTYETIGLNFLVIIKRDGRKESFDKNKILEGVKRSCEKRPISKQEIIDLSNRVEFELLESNIREVETKQIGKMVMGELKDLDLVSYVRFTSVCNDFKDLGSFEKEVKNLIRGG